MLRNLSSTILLFASFVAFPLVTSAGTITIPTGLNPGDHYRLAFVTSAIRDGVSSNIADYNAFVTKAANSSPQLAALKANWFAIASTDAIAARDNTNTNPNAAVGMPIYRLNGDLVASSNSDLWDNTLQSDIDFNEFGVRLDTTVWTGTDPNGSQSDLTLGNASTYSRIGWSDGGEIAWINTITYDPPQRWLFSLYGMSDILTVPQVPEPGGLALATIGFVTLLTIGRIRVG